MKNSASVWVSDKRGFQVSRFTSDDGREYSFGYIGDINGIINGVTRVTSLLGENSVSLCGNGENSNSVAVSFIGILGSHGQLGNVL